MPTTALNQTRNDTQAERRDTPEQPADAPARLRIVLSRPTHAGNIGATARAMKVMGLEALTIVAPKPGIFPSEEATARAVSAESLLQQAQVVDTLAEAVADCHHVVGTTARLRHIGPPLLTPRQWAEGAVARPRQQLALVFGQERTGLLNEEVDLCHALIRIPTQDGFSSLNLAMAVQILCYEWHLAAGGVLPEPLSESPPATAQELEGFFAHLRETGDAVEFFVRKNPDAVHRRLRALFGRAGLDRNEINILRGFLRDVQRKLPGGEDAAN